MKEKTSLFAKFSPKRKFDVKNFADRLNPLLEANIPLEQSLGIIEDGYKNPDDIESGSIGKDTIGYIRRSLPTLETILKRGLDKKELSLENIELQVQNLKQLEALLSKEKEFTEEEKKFLGIDGTSKKIIENMLQQGAALLEELQR